MPALIIPNNFNPNTTARSSEVNSNFSAVATLLNSTKLDSSNIQTGGLATANYADASITRAKFAVGALKDSSYELSNVSFTASVAASSLTVALKGKDGNDPSASNLVNIGFRSATATVGTYSEATSAAATSVVASSGSTLGTFNAVAAYIYVYAISNSGTIELALSGSGHWDEGSTQNTSAEGGAGGADSRNVLYSTAARTGVAIRLIGRILSTQATAGTWASSPSELSINPFNKADVSCRADLSTNQSSGGLATVKVALDQKSFDTQNCFDAVTNFRFIAQIAGRYQVNAAAYLSGLTAAQDSELQIRVNGSSLAATFREVPASLAVAHSLADILNLAAGDYVEMFVTSGGDTSFAVNSGVYTFLSIHKIN